MYFYKGLLLISHTNNIERVYHSRNNIKGQIVLYNQDNQSVTVQHYLPDNHFRNLDPNIPIQVSIFLAL